jgi:hypothetical protein
MTTSTATTSRVVRVTRNDQPQPQIRRTSNMKRTRQLMTCNVAVHFASADVIAPPAPHDSEFRVVQ